MKTVSALVIFLLGSILLAGSWTYANAAPGETGFANGWPELVVTPRDAHWHSFADYLSRELTVDFTIHNANPAAVAHGVQITGAASTSGVSLSTATPVSVGDIPAGGDAQVSLAYFVPVGVSGFQTNISGSADAAPLPLNPDPPSSQVKLIFIHHSTGENWLTDGDGNLGTTLTANNYFVSDTNYGWGPADVDEGSGTIGDHTDIGHWYSWFAGPNKATYMTALYSESGQNSSYTRIASDPGGANEIVMFKSCYPNSGLGGNPGDAATVGANPLRGQDAWSGDMTVANVKGIYNDLLPYFAAHQEKLFVVITAPPLQSGDTNASQAANARAFNSWLVDDWLDSYGYDNVAVFDFYNVLTSNGGNASTNDLGAVGGNHHRYNSGAIEHLIATANNYSSYPGGNGGGSHPTAAGGRKASGEFAQWLNVVYNRWKGI
ncbi:MAG: hypothetical protein Q7K29_03675 [Thermoleophilia bacterium]|nr:hypothetical protein [Thermoleophilia bacterium]